MSAPPATTVRPTSPAGPDLSWVAAYPVASGSGADSTIINGTAGPAMNIGILNIDGTTGTVFSQDTGSIHGTRIGHINYEPSQQIAPASNIVYSNGGAPCTVESVVLIKGAADYVFDSFNTDNVFWGSARTQNGVVNNNIVNIRNAIATDDTCYYAGPSTEVDNGNAGRGIACLSDLTLKT